MAGEDTTAPKRKRPLGLKARSAKKANTEEAPNTPAVADFADENTATVMLRGDDANEIDELEGIFESALEAIASSDSDDERATTLLRGTVHESDRLLRLHDTADAGTPLEPRFYFIYGSALFNLAELAARPDEKRTYLELAQHRLEQALAAEGEPVAGRVCLALAKVELELAAEDNAQAHVEGALRMLDRALAASEALDAAHAEALAAADMVLSLADSQRLPAQPSAALVAWGEARARELVGRQPDAEANACVLARALWLRASALLDADDEIADRGAFVELLGEASELLAAASSSDALALRGEIEINLGNAQDDEAEMEKLYGRAVATFRQAQAQGELPEQFVQFIDDFENGDSSDED
ncbi:hypothetical protein IWW55_002608 [Coemansia sp. RSA 2706]|nr:hypothetical protein IWW55_002608 [Coemansia sp. RSA 2706]KAJ2326368.1 hypothetical protein IWW51_002310 [Coemansia sp. RSA 2702]KAJ2375432.1 hypothetical protein H4S02_008228 [Coemansia sp. RSA 2611]KAJ2718075.1 hypothetical protein H4R23_005109 [Coemansia sp. Cherry 401B]